MKVVTKDNAIFHFTAKNEPIAYVQQNEEFWVETHDCYFGQIRTEKDLRPNIDGSLRNAATGPIHVAGVLPGDVICVEILDIHLNSYGIMITAPGHGILGDLVTECDTKIINIQDGFAVFSDEIKLALNPMIGVIGVSPLKSVPSTTPGDHGGNMDVKDIEIGSKVYFPVYIEGAGVAIGDLHACMADGEISGSGIEVAGRVKLRASVTQRFNISTPFVETKSKFMIISSEKTLEAAIRKGVALTCEMLQKSFKINFQDAYRLASISCDVGICQIVNPMVTVKICIPKPLLKQAIE